MRPPMTAPADVQDDDADLLLCPACRFDLRGTAGDRCGECGLEIDRAGLRVSGVPWAHRGRMGWVAAYLRTARAFARDRDVRFEAVRPQEIRDGRAFARITACFVAVALVGAFLAGVYAMGGLVALAIQPGDSVSRGVLDGAVPWCAGATIPGVLPVCLVAFALWLTSCERFAFRTRAGSTERARAAVALSYYTCSPLLLLLPAMAFGVGLAWLIRHTADSYAPQFPRAFLVYPRASLALSVVCGVTAVTAVGLTLVRVGQWVARTRQCGTGRAVLGVAEVVGLWLLGVVVLVGLVPWIVGFTCIAIDSLR